MGPAAVRACALLTATITVAGCLPDFFRGHDPCDGGSCPPALDLLAATGDSDTLADGDARRRESGATHPEGGPIAHDLKPPADKRPVDQRPPDLVDPGRWYQANQAHCPNFCSGRGRASVAGPEGAHCMSGEVRSASGIAQGIIFPYGCWSSCAGWAQAHQATTTTAGECYTPSQGQDHDVTDRTVGCFCR